MKRLLFLFAALLPLFSAAQVRVDRSDTTLQVLYGDSLVKYQPEAWVKTGLDSIATKANAAIPLVQKGAANGVAPLGADSKVPSQYLNVTGGFTYQGSWNASTNNPSLADGVGTNGDLYKVDTAGTQDLGSGSITFNVGDHVVYDGATWENFGASEAVSSVAGKTGVVLLDKSDVGLDSVNNTSDAAKPVSAAQQAALNGKVSTTGGTITGAVNLIVPADGNKLWLAKYSSGTGHTNAPTSIGATSTYLQVGGREYGNNGFGGIGFSYVADVTQHPAVWVGWEEKVTSGNTSGDFIVATRPTTTNVAPTARLRITAAGQIQVVDSAYVPQSFIEVPNKKYVDDAIGAIPTAFTGNFGAPVSHSGKADIFLSSSDPMTHLVDASGQDTEVHLPSGAMAGKVFTVKRMDNSGTGLNVFSDSGNVEGVLDIGMSAQYSYRTFIFDGSDWWLIASGGS